MMTCLNKSLNNPHTFYLMNLFYTSLPQKMKHVVTQYDQDTLTTSKIVKHTTRRKSLNQEDYSQEQEEDNATFQRKHMWQGKPINCNTNNKYGNNCNYWNDI